MGLTQLTPDSDIWSPHVVKNSFKCASIGLHTLILLAGPVAEGSDSKFVKVVTRL